MTDETGHFAVLRRSFGPISDDQRVQAVHDRLLLRRAARGAGRLRHAGGDLAVMLIALGFKPIKAASRRARGRHRARSRSARSPSRSRRWARSPACPRTTSARWSAARRRSWRSSCRSSSCSWSTAAAACARPGRPRCVGRRELRASRSSRCSNYISIELADIIAALVSAGAWSRCRASGSRASRCLRGRPPRGLSRHRRCGDPRRRAGGAARERDGRERAATLHEELGERRRRGDSAGEILVAFAPYLIIIAVFVIFQVGADQDLAGRDRAGVRVARAAHPHARRHGAEVGDVHVQLPAGRGHGAAHLRPADHGRAAGAPAAGRSASTSPR